MKIWIVERVDYDVEEKLGVFLTKRKAERVAAEKRGAEEENERITRILLDHGAYADLLVKIVGKDA